MVNYAPTIKGSAANRLIFVTICPHVTSEEAITTTFQRPIDSLHPVAIITQVSMFIGRELVKEEDLMIILGYFSQFLHKTICCWY